MMAHNGQKKATSAQKMSLKGALSERDWQQQVRQIARLYGWTMQYHTHDARRSDPGWPDLVLHHPELGRTIFAELKTDSGKITAAQAEWLHALGISGLETAVWRPRDTRTVQAVLGPAQQPTYWLG